MIQDIPDWTSAIKEATKIILGKSIDGFECESKALTEPISFQQASAILGKALEILLISKNLKYGKGNILNSTDFGIEPTKGVALRMNDKFERLKNGLQGVDLGKEGFIDSFGDLVGYNAIGLLLKLPTSDGKSWYELPIQQEDPK